MKTPIKIEDLRGPNGIMFGTTEVRRGQYPVRKLICHNHPHWDEIVAVWLLRRDSEFFPGVENASVQFLQQNGGVSVPDALEHLKQGLLLVGFGDGPFNEHEVPSHGEVAGECAATVVAGLLGMRDDSGLHHLLKDVRAMDRHPREYPANVDSHIANIVKAMSEAGASDEEVFDWATRAVEVIYLKQTAFLVGVARKFPEVHTELEMSLADGRPVKVAVIRGVDDEVFSRYALSRKQNFSVVVTIRSGGNIFVGTNKFHGISPPVVAEIFRLLAIRDLEKRGQPVPQEYLRIGAKLPADVGVLHLWDEGGGVLNKGEPVKLSEGEILPLIKLGLGFRRHDQVQTGHSDQHTGDQLTQNCGELDPHHQLSQQARSYKNDQKLPY